MTTSEFRRAKRRKVDQRIEVLDTMTGRMIGHLSDLSETGMLLILNKPLMSDALYQLSFKLSNGNGIERAIEVGAHELWSDPAAAPGLVWTGFRFLAIGPSDLLFLRAWVNAPGSEHI